MAAIKEKIRGKMAQEIVHFLVVLQILNRIGLCQPTVESSGQAFVQTDKELRYMFDGMILDPASYRDKVRDDSSKSIVIFEPPLLDFEEQPVGMPRLQKVTIQNIDSQKKLQLVSISGSTSHFHCSFFQEKLVPPGGNTTFEVVFLARKIGNVENTLYIHTSEGTIRYQVFGVGITNPYRVGPLLGAKVALNTSFSPLIVLHNPHSTALQVQEVYSSGDDLHLQLPTGDFESSQVQWEIPPYDTKPIMRANFLGRIENNHTAFIRIKTNQDNPYNYLVLPLEVEVNADPGIFSTIDKLDFGIVRTSDPAKTLELNLYSSRVYPVPIHKVTVSPPNDAVQIQFKPTFLRGDLWEPSTIAHITFNASKVTSIKQTSGVIVVNSKSESHHFVIPYQVNVLHGSIFYDKNKMIFYSGQAIRTISRNLPITNLFNFSLAIHNITISEDKAAYFTIDKFQGPLVIREGDTKVPLLLHFHLNKTNTAFRTHLRLHTNASTFYLPIVVYNGKLKAVHHRPEVFRGQLDFGTLDVDTEYLLLLTLRNENPVNVIIHEYAANVGKSHVELLGVEDGNRTMLTRFHNTSLIPSPLTLKPNQYAVFNISLRSVEIGSAFAGECIFYTQFENLYVPITLLTVSGGLKPSSQILLLDNCFPGKPCKKQFSVANTFEMFMVLRELTFQPNDTRFYSVPYSEREQLFQPRTNITIGTVVFDPKHGASGCHSDCYVGLSTYTQAGRHWLEGTSLQLETASIDRQLHNRSRQRWQSIQQQHQDVLNATLQLETDQMRGFLYHVQAHLHYPSLVKQRRLDFPLTQIGNTSVDELIVQNPSEDPVIIQAFPLLHYPDPQTILNILGDSIQDDLVPILDNTFSSVFTIQDLRPSNRKYNYSMFERHKLENRYDIRSHPESLLLTVNTSSTYKIQVGFTPIDDNYTASLLVIRNNLTVLEAVVLSGSGGRGDMRFDSKEVVGSTLVFEVTDKNCDKRQSSKSTPYFTVKKGFPLKNTGQLPIFVSSFSINGQPCEGYGFKVQECKGVHLAPNESKTITIAFAPDFSMSKVQHTLTLHTSLGPAFNYTVQANVPPYLLNKCAAALPRPTWEPLLYYCMVCVMGFVLFSICAAACLEADSIHAMECARQAYELHNHQLGIDRGKVFDLNNLNGEKSLANGGSVLTQRQNADITGGGSLGKQQIAHTQSTAEQRNVETITPATFTSAVPRPSSARKRRGGGGHSDDHNFTVAWLRNFYKVFVSYAKVPLRYSYSVLKSALSRAAKFSLFSAASLNSKSDKESKSTSVKTSSDKQQSVTKTEVSASLASTQTLLQRQSSTDQRDDETNGLQSRSSNKKNSVINPNSGNSRAAAKRPFPDVVKDAMRSSESKRNERDSKTNVNTEATRKSKKSSSNKKTSRSNSDFMDSSEGRSQNSTPEILDDQALTKVGKLSRKLRDAGLSLERRLNSENDDTSSTTTESSLDDKSSSQDRTPEPVIPKLKRSRSTGEKTKNLSKPDLESYEVRTSEGILPGEDYIIGSKNRLHKKGSNDLSGNIFRPSSLELPYKLHGDSPKANKTSDGYGSTTNKRLLKTRKQKRKQPQLSPFSSYGQLDDSNLSPLPFWDQPRPNTSNDDLSDIALQTHLFATRVGSRGGGGVGGGQGGEQLSTSSRSSSYSSVVSSSSDKNAVNKSQTVSPGSGHDPRTPGGALSPGSNAKKSTWSSQDSQNSPGNSFGLEPITELNGVPVAPFSGIFTGMTNSGRPTLMQEMTAERRQRILLHEQQRKMQAWPFFDTPLPSDQVLASSTATWVAPGSSLLNSGSSLMSTSSVWTPNLDSTSTPSPLFGNIDLVNSAAIPSTSGNLGWGGTLPVSTTSGGYIWGSYDSPGGFGSDEAGVADLMDNDRAAPASFNPFNNLWDPSSFNMQGGGWPSFSPPKPDDN